MARVALYGAGGSPYNHAAILARAGHDIRFVFPADIVAGRLDGFDVFVMPGGGYRAMQGQLEPLGADGCRAVREWVERGGMYIGSCAGSYDAATVPPAFLEICPEQAELCLLPARVWNDGGSMFGVLQSPGTGLLETETVSPEHPVMAGMPDRFPMTHYNGPLFTGGAALTHVAGTGELFTAAERFLDPAALAALIEQAVAEGIANAVAGEHGAGRVVLFGSHPEFGSTIALDDVGVAATMLTNAVDWQLAAAPARAPLPVITDDPVPAAVRKRDLAVLPDLVGRLGELSADLAACADSPWLAESVAMALLGRSGRETWIGALDRLPELAAEAAAGAGTVPEPLLSFRPPVNWSVDGGFHGIVPLLEQAESLLLRGLVALQLPAPDRADEAYSGMRETPYHLVAGSYLAAIGRVAGAALLVRGVQ